jgi:hypothetical protein
MSPGEATSRDPLVQLTELWAGLFEHADAQCQAVLKGFEFFYDPWKLRGGFLVNLSQAMQGYLRSPPVLELIRTSLNTMNTVNVIQDQFVHDFARRIGVPLSGDVYELSDQLRRNEAILTTRLKAIEDRLTSIETRLDASLSPD